MKRDPDWAYSLVAMAQHHETELRTDLLASYADRASLTFAVEARVHGEYACSAMIWADRDHDTRGIGFVAARQARHCAVRACPWLMADEENVVEFQSIADRNAWLETHLVHVERSVPWCDGIYVIPGALMTVEDVQIRFALQGDRVM